MDAFRKLIISYLVKIGVRLTGVKGWIASTIIDKFIVAGWNWIIDKLLQAKRDQAKKRDEERAAKYEDTLKDGASKNDQRSATSDLLNGQ